MGAPGPRVSVVFICRSVSFIYDTLMKSMAEELLDEYWRNHNDGETTHDNKRKRVTIPDEDTRAMPPPPPRAPRRTRQAGGNNRQAYGQRSVKYNGHDVIVDEAYPQNADTIDWEKQVKAVELVAPHKEGVLEAIIQW